MIVTPFTSDLVVGVAELEATPRGITVHRLPAWVRQQFPDPQLLAMEAQPSGARITFSTASSRIELITHPKRITYRSAERARGRIDVLVNGVLHTRDELSGGDRLEVDLQTGASSTYKGGRHTTFVDGLGGGTKDVEFWLPHNEAINLVELRTDARVVAKRNRLKLWVHHGSSISQGSNALGPTEVWPTVAARAAGNIELQNLGLGGSALVDPFVARVMRDSPADVISVKLGINVVNLDSMRLRAFVPAVNGFLDTIRDGHPETPLLLISPIFCGIHENTPGPGAVDTDTLGTGQVQFIATGRPGDTVQGRLTLQIIRDALRAVVERRRDDANLHYVDGLQLYGLEDSYAHPLPDGLHPNSAAHSLIGRRFAEHLLVHGGLTP